MQKISFLFPGQGSQFVGMGASLYRQPEAARLFDRAEEALGFALKRICFEGPEEELRQTRITQPAIFTHSVAADLLLKSRGIHPDSVAGHSLGEYSALVSAGALSFEDGLRLVKIRGELMQIAGEKHPGTMAAIIGLDGQVVANLCSGASQAGVVQPANFNSPGQVVISGSVEGVHKAMAAAREAGARMAKELVVSGAFHSPLMADALEGLIDALAAVEIATPKIPVYTNVEATPTTDPQHLRKLLGEQLMSPVRWEMILRNMIADGFDTFYEVGPGKVLQGLLKRTDSEFAAIPAGTMEDLAAL